ncbi:MAG: hypothetical protein LV481_15720, partial [Methylacidiphilales bacterium]|nr:hypothetical protein [Candidatus Methylacidiphilales bacterium]
MIQIKNPPDSDLCNVMFQYAFGFTTARRLGTSFCMSRLRDYSAYGLDSLFELGGDTSAANALRKLRFKLASLMRRPVEKRWLDFNDGRYASPEKVLADLSDHAFYRGYFQSSRYFTGCETEVKNLFRVKEPLRHRFERRYADYLRGAPLGILHLRGKFHGAWERVRLPWSYFENCLERVPDRENYRWLVLTDDVDYVRHNFPEACKMEIASGEVIDDFQLMSRATI